MSGRGSKGLDTQRQLFSLSLCPLVLTVSTTAIICAE